MSCSTCNEQDCPTPQACLRPEAAPRAPMFRPSFDLEGPHRRIRRPRWWLVSALTLLALAGLITLVQLT